MELLKVRKLRNTEAMQITDEASKRLVLMWLEHAGFPPETAHVAIADLIESKVYFMRDEGDTAVYLTSEKEFQTGYEIVGLRIRQEDTPPVTPEFEAAIRDILKDI